MSRTLHEIFLLGRILQGNVFSCKILARCLAEKCIILQDLERKSCKILARNAFFFNQGPLFICFDILQHNGCHKIPKGPPFTFFGTVQKSHFYIFLGKGSSPQRAPLQFFFHILQPAGVSQSPKGSPFTILSLRYNADFGRSRLVRFKPFYWTLYY